MLLTVITIPTISLLHNGDGKQKTNIIQWHTADSPFRFISYFKTIGCYRMEVKVIHLLDDRNRYTRNIVTILFFFIIIHSNTLP